jgi:hypothetical protein
MTSNYASLLGDARIVVDRLGFHVRDVLRLTDDATDPRNQPTKTNILGAMQWLVRGARSHDSLFFHCACLFQVPVLTCQHLHLDSGHGAQVRDQNGDEVSGYDEGNVKGLSTYLLISMNHSDLSCGLLRRGHNYR